MNGLPERPLSTAAPAARPAFSLSSRGMVIGWHGPLGPTVAWFDAWSRERPEAVFSLGRPGRDQAVVPALAPIDGGFLVAYCEHDGAWVVRMDAEGLDVARRVVDGAYAIALAGETLLAADAEGIVAVRLGKDGSPLAPPRRVLGERRAGARLVATLVREEVLAVVAFEGDDAFSTISLRGEETRVVRHPGTGPLAALHVTSAGSKAAVALGGADGQVRLALVGSGGKLIERPHPVFGIGLGALTSPAVVFVERQFLMLARSDADDVLVATSAGADGATFTLPRVLGPFAVAYHAQSLYTLEVEQAGDDARMHLWRCDKTGGELQQRVDLVHADEGGARRAAVDAQRLVKELGDRFLRGASYRGEAARVELAENEPLARWVSREGQLSVAIARTAEGWSLRAASAVGEDAALPAPSTSLVRLAVWVRSRLRAADRERAGEEMAFAARLGAGLDADVIAFDRAGSAWVLTLALADLPDVDTLYVWARELIALQETST